MPSAHLRLAGPPALRDAHMLLPRMPGPASSVTSAGLCHVRQLCLQYCAIARNIRVADRDMPVSGERVLPTSGGAQRRAAGMPKRLQPAGARHRLRRHVEAGLNCLTIETGGDASGKTLHERKRKTTVAAEPTASRRGPGCAAAGCSAFFLPHNSRGSEGNTEHDQSLAFRRRAPRPCPNFAALLGLDD